MLQRLGHAVLLSLSDATCGLALLNSDGIPELIPHLHLQLHGSKSGLNKCSLGIIAVACLNVRLMFKHLHSREATLANQAHPSMSGGKRQRTGKSVNCCIHVCNTQQHEVLLTCKIQQVRNNNLQPLKSLRLHTRRMLGCLRTRQTKSAWATYTHLDDVNSQIAERNRVWHKFMNSSWLLCTPPSFMFCLLLLCFCRVSDIASHWYNTQSIAHKSSPPAC